MLANKIITCLLFFFAIALSPFATAALFCPVTMDGKIRLDECKYSSNEACKEASESKMDCVADQPAASTKAPYCLITGLSEVCDKYYDYESCDLAAQKQVGQCIVNAYYIKAD
jgi:hypothetical protein